MLTNRFFKKFVLGVAGAFLLVVAVAFKLEQLYLMAAILFLLPLVSYLIGRALLLGLTCERVAPPSCSVGEQVPVTLTLGNTGALPKFSLRVRDRLPKWARAANGEPPPLLQLWPGEAGQTTYLLEAARRGLCVLGPAQALSTDPLGFFDYAQTLPGTTEVLVYPQVLPVRRLALDGAGAWGTREMDNAAARGGGLDFHGVREYRQGDELRRVHWRTTARTGTLAVMEYTQGQASDVLIALDMNANAYAHTGEGGDSALEYAITLTATLCDALLREGYVARLLLASLPNGPLVLHDRSEMPRLLEMLARADADAAQSLAEVLQRHAEEAARGATLVFITPAASDPALATALAEWGARGARRLGLALDGPSFQTENNGARGRRRGSSVSTTPDAGSLPDGVAVQRVRRGDDLQQVLEGLSYAR